MAARITRNLARIDCREDIHEHLSALVRHIRTNIVRNDMPTGVRPFHIKHDTVNYSRYRLVKADVNTRSLRIEARLYIHHSRQHSGATVCSVRVTLRDVNISIVYEERAGCISGWRIPPVASGGSAAFYWVDDDDPVSHPDMLPLYGDAHKAIARCMEIMGAM